MALLQVNFISDVLKRTVPFTAILPVDKLFGDPFGIEEQKAFKTLYLLHGLLGNYTDWIPPYPTIITGNLSGKNLSP